MNYFFVLDDGNNLCKSFLITQGTYWTVFAQGVSRQWGICDYDYAVFIPVLAVRFTIIPPDTRYKYEIRFKDYNDDIDDNGNSKNNYYSNNDNYNEEGIISRISQNNNQAPHSASKTLPQR